MRNHEPPLQPTGGHGWSESAILARTPVRDLLALLKPLRAAWTQTSRIWAKSAYANGGGRERIESMLEFEDALNSALKEKKVSKLECVAPDEDNPLGFVRV